MISFTVNDHITPVLRELHWLPVEKRITYKILLITVEPSLTRASSNSNQNRFPVDFVHTFTVILHSITRTLDNSNLSLARTNFHFPSSNFAYNLALDNSNNVFQDVTNKKIDKGYSPAGRSVLGKTVPEVLDTQDTWVLKTEGIVCPIRTDLGW